MSYLKQLQEYENLHIFLWLLKDACWLTVWKTGGLIMAVPTIIVALHLTWLKRHNINEFLHNIAVCNWIIANTIWMLGEFFYNDSLRPISALFFSLGFFSLAIYYLILLPRRLKAQSIK
jgi:hypothetical protein